MTHVGTHLRFHQDKHSDTFHDYRTENVESRAYTRQKVYKGRCATDTALSQELTLSTSCSGELKMLHFLLLFPQCFQKLLSKGSLKSQDCNHIPKYLVHHSAELWLLKFSLCLLHTPNLQRVQVAGKKKVWNSLTLITDTSIT